MALQLSKYMFCTCMMEPLVAVFNEKLCEWVPRVQNDWMDGFSVKVSSSTKPATNTDETSFLLILVQGN